MKNGQSGVLNIICRTENHRDEALPGPALVTPLASAYPPLMPQIVLNGTNGVTLEANGDAEEDRKPEREHKKRSKNWTRPEILRLIRLRTELAPQFARTGRKGDLWEQIAVGLQQHQFMRDAQQCRDKWEKLMAGYKEVRDGVKGPEDNPFFEELQPLLSGKSVKKDKGIFMFAHEAANDPAEFAEEEVPHVKTEGTSDENDDAFEEGSSLGKRKRGYAGFTDFHVIQTLLETVMTRQQTIIKEFLEALEHREQLHEHVRQEREEKWREEERAQRAIFNNAMIILAQKLVNERVESTSTFPASVVCNPLTQSTPVKRSKNWNRGEVLQLIKLRTEMEAKFLKSSRRAVFWDEIADVLRSQEIKRDAKQCREKWEKLMAEYKDVQDGKREKGDSPYFHELSVVFRAQPDEAA